MRVYHLIGLILDVRRWQSTRRVRHLLTPPKGAPNIAIERGFVRQLLASYSPHLWQQRRSVAKAERSLPSGFAWFRLQAHFEHVFHKGGVQALEIVAEDRGELFETLLGAVG